MRRAYLDTLALRQTDPGPILANDEDVGVTRGEAVVDGVLEMDDTETTLVALTMGDDADTAHVTTTSDHCDNTGIELDEIGDLAGFQIDLHGVVDLDEWVGVADPVRQFGLVLRKNWPMDCDPSLDV